MSNSFSTSLTASAAVSFGSGAVAPSQEATLGCRFYVKVDGLHHAVFTEVSGLSMEMEILLVEEGGNNHAFHRLPGRLKEGNITLKRGISRGNELFNWMLSTTSGTIQRKDVSIVLCGLDGGPHYQWDISNAYPFRWSCIPFRAGVNEVAIETLELCYESLRMATLQEDGASGQVSASASHSVGGLSVSGSASLGVSTSGSGVPSIDVQVHGEAQIG